MSLSAGWGQRGITVGAAAVVAVILSGPPAWAARDGEHGGTWAAWSRDPADAPLTWRQVGRDAVYVFTRPAHLDGAGWGKVAWTLGIGSSLYLVREDVAEWSQDHGSESLDDFLQDVRIMGKGATVPLVALGFYLAGKARHSPYERETAVVLLESATATFAITALAQVVVATDRPEDGDRVRFFKSDGHSVSTDTALAASLLAPIIDRHLQIDVDDSRAVRFWKRCGTWGLYGAAGLVAYQRINQNKHYLPDVYFGYATGLTMGRLVVNARKREREQPDSRRRVQVSASPMGLSIRW